MTPSLESLLTYRERDQHASDHHRRPWTPARTGVPLVETDGREAFYLIPAPANLARVYAGPLLGETLELFRSSTGLLARPLGSAAAPDPLDVDAAVASLVSALQTLPAREYTSALQSYSFLRTFVALAPAPELDRYARATVATLARRSDLKEWRPPKPARERSTKTSTDYMREQRAREREDARAVVAKWVPTLAPGRHDLGRVWEAYVEAVEHSEKVAAQYPGARVIGRRALYALLREFFEVVPGGGHRQLVIIPTPIPMEEPVTPIEAIRAEAAAIRERADAKYAEANADEMRLDVLKRLDERQRERLSVGDRVGALRSQRERLATGTDGAPVDLAAERAARR